MESPTTRPSSARIHGPMRLQDARKHLALLPSRGLMAGSTPHALLLPANFTFGNEPRVDSSLRSDGVNNFDFAIFKRITFGPDARGGFETRVEVFNLFNHTQFGPPNTICCTANNANFGFVTSTAPGTNPRLIQFAMKFLSELADAGDPGVSWHTEW